MSNPTKRFPARVLLTVTTGRLLTQARSDEDNGIGDLYEMLGWMTGDDPFTHQLPRFVNECRPHLLKWFPELASAEQELPALDRAMIACKGTNPESVVASWLAGLVESGNILAEYDVTRIPAGDHLRKNPITEAAEMFDGKIVVVETE